MSQYLLIKHIKVQDANAVAGFTWGFPAITHFLGFTHNLSRKLQKHDNFFDIHLSGCAVIAHHHQVHTYGYNQLTQSKKPAYQYKEQAKNKVGSPPVIEEGKMNMTVSLLIKSDGNIGNRKDSLVSWLTNVCKRQRLAGGTVLDIADIDFLRIDNEQNKGNLRGLIHKLLPGFVLIDRSDYLEEHFHYLQSKNSEAELFDAWLDFIALKQKARPVSEKINRHLNKLADSDPENIQYQKLLELWLNHLEKPYNLHEIPEELMDYFSTVPENKANKPLLDQWQAYCSPDEKTDATWEYITKHKQGFLVPLMVGYKAISPLYKNAEVANTRDNETDVCFVEAIHSIGEWQGMHRIKDEQALSKTLWNYHAEKNWYLCKQGMIDVKPEEKST